MSIDENIQRGIKKRTTLEKDDLAEQFTDIFSEALKTFMTKLNSGDIEVNSLTDMQRVFVMWQEITQYNEKMEADSSGIAGALPQLSSKESAVVREANILTEDGESVDLTKKTPEEIQELGNQLISAMNNENAGGA